MGLAEDKVAAEDEIKKVINEAKDVPIQATEGLHEALARLVIKERAEKQNLEARALSALLGVEHKVTHFLIEWKLPIAVCGGALLGAALTWLGFAARWVYG